MENETKKRHFFVGVMMQYAFKDITTNFVHNRDDGQFPTMTDLITAAKSFSPGCKTVVVLSISELSKDNLERLLSDTDGSFI